jgi:hypothetical protein
VNSNLVFKPIFLFTIIFLFPLSSLEEEISFNLSNTTVLLGFLSSYKKTTQKNKHTKYTSPEKGLFIFISI